MFSDLLAAHAALVDGRDCAVELPDRSPAQADMDGDAEFFRVNALLRRNPSIVNLLDGCALSPPGHHPDELPIGPMICAGSLRDDRALDIVPSLESALARAGD